MPYSGLYSSVSIAQCLAVRTSVLLMSVAEQKNSYLPFASFMPTVPMALSVLPEAVVPPMMSSIDSSTADWAPPQAVSATDAHRARTVLRRKAFIRHPFLGL